VTAERAVRRVAAPAAAAGVVKCAEESGGPRSAATRVKALIASHAIVRRAVELIVLMKLLAVANGVELAFSAAELVSGVVERVVATTEVIDAVESCLRVQSAVDVVVAMASIAGAGVTVDRAVKLLGWDAVGHEVGAVVVVDAVEPYHCVESAADVKVVVTLGNARVIEGVEKLLVLVRFEAERVRAAVAGCRSDGWIHWAFSRLVDVEASWRVGKVFEIAIFGGVAVVAITLVVE
jgi:hypothetical protein